MTSKLRAIAAIALVTTFTVSTSVGCGKSKDKSKAGPPAPGGGGATAGTGAAPPKPDKPPVKAASRGPEHPVYSLIDNRLSGAPGPRRRPWSWCRRAPPSSPSTYAVRQRPQDQRPTLPWQMRKQRSGATVKVARS
jgi:hypothetical protein